MSWKGRRALTPQEKASLAHILIEELDPAVEAGVEQVWIEEAQRRYDAYLKGELEPYQATRLCKGRATA